MRKIIPKPVIGKVEVTVESEEKLSCTDAGQDKTISLSGITASTQKGKVDADEPTSAYNAIANDKPTTDPEKLTEQQLVEGEREQSNKPSETEDLVCLALKSIEITKEECDMSSFLKNNKSKDLAVNLRESEPGLSSLLRDLEVTVLTCICLLYS